MRNINYSDFLKKLYKYSKLKYKITSKKDFANFIGISENYAHQLFSGRRSLSYSLLNRICELFKIPKIYILIYIITSDCNDALFAEFFEPIQDNINSFDFFNKEEIEKLSKFLHQNIRLIEVN